MPISLNGSPPLPLVVLSRCGVNSGAIIIKLVQAGIKIDAIIIQVTGYLTVPGADGCLRFSNWLKDNPKIGYYRIHRIIPKPNHRSSTQDSALAMAQFACARTLRWDPALKAILEWHSEVLPPKQPLLVAMPFDVDEEQRSNRRSQAPGLYEFWYPLIEWGMTREDCAQLCSTEGLHTADSRCFFCPTRSKADIAYLGITEPSTLQTALAIEKELGDTAGFGGLGGRGWKWADFVSATPEQAERMAEPPLRRLPCHCYDG